MESSIGGTLPEVKETQGFLLVLCVLYIFLSYFEIYLRSVIGTGTKYVILLMSLTFLHSNKWKIRINTYTIFICLWFLFKVVSIAWSNLSNTDVSRTILSQIGMVLLFTAMCGQIRDRKLLLALLQANYWCSLLFGVLTLLFHRSYISQVYIARQVLTLFGRQNDPNNCAAFLCIGITIAVYSLVAEKQMKGLNIAVILINAYGVILSGSRMGFLLLGLIAIVLILMPNTKDRFIIGSFLKKLGITLFVLAIGLWIVNHFLPAESLRRVLAFDEYSMGSGRIEIWRSAVDYIKEKPLFGWGWGGYSFTDSVIHNTYLTILCDTGAVGFLLFMIPMVILIYQLISRKNQLGLLLLIIGMVSGFFLDAINKRFFWNAIIISVAMLLNYEKTNIPMEVWPAKNLE